MKIFDVHAHLDALEDVNQSLAEAKKTGVASIIGVGMDITSNERVLELARRFNGYVLPAIGYHPWMIKKAQIEQTLQFLSSHSCMCSALGEVGLDYKTGAHKDLQKKVLKEIISLAESNDKPLILHCRYSHARVFQMVQDGGVQKAIFHWYIGSTELLEQIVAAGYYISATPALTYSTPHRLAIKQAPLERILLETDSPVRYEGKQSRPADAWITAREVALLKHLPLEKVAAITFQSSKEFFQVA